MMSQKNGKPAATSATPATPKTRKPRASLTDQIAELRTKVGQAGIDQAELLVRAPDVLRLATLTLRNQPKVPKISKSNQAILDRLEGDVREQTLAAMIAAKPVRVKKPMPAVA